jgi:hypothetical protein
MSQFDFAHHIFASIYGPVIDSVSARNLENKPVLSSDFIRELVDNTLKKVISDCAAAVSPDRVCTAALDVVFGVYKKNGVTVDMKFARDVCAIMTEEVTKYIVAVATTTMTAELTIVPQAVATPASAAAATPVTTATMNGNSASVTAARSVMPSLFDFLPVTPTVAPTVVPATTATSSVWANQFSHSSAAPTSYQSIPSFAPRVPMNQPSFQQNTLAKPVAGVGMQSAKKEKRVCVYHIVGKCTRGSSCHYSHESVSDEDKLRSMTEFVISQWKGTDTMKDAIYMMKPLVEVAAGLSREDTSQDLLVARRMQAEEDRLVSDHRQGQVGVESVQQTRRPSDQSVMPFNRGQSVQPFTGGQGGMPFSMSVDPNATCNMTFVNGNQKIVHNHYHSKMGVERVESVNGGKY